MFYAKTYQFLALCAAATIFVTPTLAAQQLAPPAPEGPAATTPVRPRSGMQGPKSPEITADGTVIFRLKAPEATTVAVSGSWQKNWRPNVTPPLAMTKEDDGIWKLTLNGLKPEMWNYYFVVDGVSMPDPGNVNSLRSEMNFFIIPGPGSALYREADVPHGTVHQIWYPSPILNMAARRMYVYTPAGYELGQQRYPVLYLLHGSGGTEESWVNNGRASEIFDNLIAAGKAKPMIVVMTNGNWNQIAAPGITQQTEMSSGADGSTADRAGMSNSMKVSSSIVADVVPFVDRSFRTIADRDHRAIAGLSMGGAQTLYAGLNHLDQFSYVASFSGALIMFPGASRAVLDSANAPMMSSGAMPELAGASALSVDFPNLNSSVNQKLRLLYLSCGEDDRLLTANKQFMDWLTSQGINYKKFLLPGYAHEWPFWRISLSDLLPQLFK